MSNVPPCGEKEIQNAAETFNGRNLESISPPTSWVVSGIHQRWSQHGSWLGIYRWYQI